MKITTTAALITGQQVTFVECISNRYAVYKQRKMYVKEIVDDKTVVLSPNADLSGRTKKVRTISWNSSLYTI